MAAFATFSPLPCRAVHLPPGNCARPVAPIVRHARMSLAGRGEDKKKVVIVGAGVRTHLNEFTRRQ